jgi:hypothetical protein
MAAMSRLFAALAGAAMAVTTLVVAAPPASAAAATRFLISIPATVSPDQPFTVSVTAADANGGRDYNYAGVVHFTSSDDVARLPADYEFVKADGGSHTFTDVVFRQQGIQTLKVSDIAKPAITGQGETQVGNGNATAQTLSVDLPNGAKYREPATIVVIAIDNLGRQDSGYRGSVHFTSTDNIATLPADYQFTPADAGRHEFVNGVMFRSQGPQRIHVQDALSPSIYGDREVVVGTYPTPAASATPTGPAPGAQATPAVQPPSGLSATPAGRATPQGSRSLPFTGAQTSRLVAMGLALLFGGLLLLAGRTLRRASQT